MVSFAKNRHTGRETIFVGREREERMKMKSSVLDVSLNSLLDIQVVMPNREFYLQT